MKNAKISANVIRRLPRYLRKLDDLAYHGMERISSGELGKRMGLTPSQIRQDFSCFGEFGQQGYGYNIQMLREEIASILGMQRHYSVILVGTGNLGHALLQNFGFQEWGFSMGAGFDIDPELVGTEISGVPIFHVDELESYLREHPADVAILATPRRFAQDVAKRLVESGIEAIWNFTNIDVEIEKDHVLVEDIHFSDSLLTLSYLLKESRDAREGGGQNGEKPE